MQYVSSRAVWLVSSGSDSLLNSLTNSPSAGPPEKCGLLLTPFYPWVWLWARNVAWMNCFDCVTAACIKNDPTPRDVLVSALGGTVAYSFEMPLQRLCWEEKQPGDSVFCPVFLIILFFFLVCFSSQPLPQFCLIFGCLVFGAMGAWHLEWGWQVGESLVQHISFFLVNAMR